MTHEGDSSDDDCLPKIFSLQTLCVFALSPDDYKRELIRNSYLEYKHKTVLTERDAEVKYRRNELHRKALGLNYTELPEQLFSEDTVSKLKIEFRAYDEWVRREMIEKKRAGWVFEVLETVREENSIRLHELREIYSFLYSESKPTFLNEIHKIFNFFTGGFFLQLFISVFFFELSLNSLFALSLWVFAIMLILNLFYKVEQFNRKCQEQILRFIKIREIVSKL